MGTKIGDLIITKEVNLKDLKDRIIVVDASMFLYQFLTTIRQADGSPLMDSKGHVTSHLTGLFSRTAKLVESGLKLAYVFDGKPPDLKIKEKERRAEVKAEAKRNYDIAKERGDLHGMKKYAGRTSKLTREMVEEAKQLIAAFGIPIIQAPSEAEAQAAHIVKNGDAYALATQDADALIFGTPKLLRNLSILGKRKKINSLSYKTVKPEIIELSEILNELGLDNNQLIALAMLVGTDYNLGGIKGIGPKNALKLVKEFKEDLESLFEHVKWNEYFDYPWTEVYYLIKKMPVSDDYVLEWKELDEENIKKILIEDHDFSEERVNSALSKIMKQEEASKQKGLGDFI